MFSHFGLKDKETIIRNVPNKTMPSRNSPTNIPGQLRKTMWNEYIVIVGRGNMNLFSICYIIFTIL